MSLFVRCILVLCFTLTKASAQTSVEGAWLPARGDYNVLLVYAEAVNDPTYWSKVYDDWPAGQMPKQPNKYFNEPGSATKNAYVTSYYHRASFGAFNFNAVVWPELLQIDFKEASYQSAGVVAKRINERFTGNTAIIEKLNALDRWTPKPGFQPKQNSPDSMLDALIVVWRVNSKISEMSNTGYCAPANQFIPILGFKGINCTSEFQAWENNAIITLRHELAHAIYGGNNFHTGGAGAGTRAFIPSVSGYSLLSSWDSHSYGFNGWDRDRLGWKNPGKKFVTSAFKIAPKGLVETAFEQNKPPTFSNGKFLIRDFVRTGDAICLRLPGPDSPRLRQYLWLEYHTDTTVIDYPDTTRHGVYAYVQVGKDDKTNTYSNGQSSPGNFTFPLPASGRWDFIYETVDSLPLGGIVRRDDRFPNPINGHHLLMRPVLDLNNDGTLDKFFPQAYVSLGDSLVHRYTVFGNNDDPFKKTTQTRINAVTNPSTNTLITHNYPQRRANQDADTSFITGLDISMADTLVTVDGRVERCAVVDVRWSRFVVDRDVRWCATIAFKKFNTSTNVQKLTVDSGAVLWLDRSFTPMQQKINTTDTVNGQLYFSPPTTFTLYSGTQLVLKKGATLKLTNGSKLYVRKGADLVFEDGSRLDAQNGSVVYLD